MTIRRLSLVAIGLLLFGAAGVVARHVLMPAVPAPTAVAGVDADAVWRARLPDLDGRGQALAQWRGKVVVLNFWAPWCPPCREEIPGFTRMQTRLGEAGLQFVGVALDAPEKVAAFAEENDMNYPNLLGGPEGAALSRQAGNRLGGLPYTVVFDRAGVAVASLSGAVDESRLEALVAPLLRP